MPDKTIKLESLQKWLQYYVDTTKSRIEFLQKQAKEFKDDESLDYEARILVAKAKLETFQFVLEETKKGK